MWYFSASRIYIDIAIIDRFYLCDGVMNVAAKCITLSLFELFLWATIS